MQPCDTSLIWNVLVGVFLPFFPWCLSSLLSSVGVFLLLLLLLLLSFGENLTYPNYYLSRHIINPDRVLVVKKFKLPKGKFDNL